MRIRTVSLFFLLLCIVSCSRSNTKKIDLTIRENEMGEKYNKVETLKNGGEIDIDGIDLEIPDGGELSAFCFSEDKVYYAIDFMEYLTPKVEGEKVPEFEDKYNTCIMSYDKMKNKKTVIYQYNETKCVEVVDIKCNGNRLVWEEIGGGYGWQVKYLELGKSLKPEVIIKKDYDKEGFNIISLTLYDNKLYWNDFAKGDKKQISIYGYDFKTKTVDIVAEKNHLHSPYEAVNMIDGFYCTSEEQDDKISIIHIYDNKTKKNQDILVQGEVALPITNGKVCVWSKVEGGVLRKDILCVYDLENDVIDKIEVPYIFSYMPYGNGILVNHDKDGKSEICLYDIKNKEYCKLLSEDIYLYTFSTNVGEVYFENIVNGLSKIMLIKWREE